MADFEYSFEKQPQQEDKNNRAPYALYNRARDIKNYAPNLTDLNDQDRKKAEEQLSQLKNMIKPNNNGINISVIDPTPKNDKFHKYVDYTIKGDDKEGKFEVVRSQQQIAEIRELLVARWPGCYIPALPPKRKINNTTVGFIEQRRKQYQIFFQKLSEINHLYYSPEFQVFLRSNGVDLALQLINFGKLDFSEIETRLKQVFGQLLEHEVTDQIIKEIEDFKRFLIKSSENVKTYRKVFKQMLNSRKAYINQYTILQNCLSYGYEKKILNNYIHPAGQGENVLDQVDIDLDEKMDKIKGNVALDPTDHLYAWIKFEQWDIDGFLENIAIREKYLSFKVKAGERQRKATKELESILSGGATLRTIFSRQSRDEHIAKIETEIKHHNKESDNLKTLVEKITLAMSFSEIQRFKMSKLEEYKYIMLMTSQNELIKLEDMMGFWRVIYDNNINLEAKKIGQANK